MSTDYDCWKVEEEAVSVQAVIANLNANSANAQKLLLAVLPTLERKMDQGSFKAIKQLQGSNRMAVITAPEKRHPDVLAKLDFILPGYFR
jgi:5'-methylthioadenosine phosphorylase